ncbi:hypothetical protein PPACK8108_LOCUS12238 [Phakopsora pachyrhizi]|uniref:Uncharacterized protein n=1 Tax=Phakopsora pachyrhizi TaxID=170000 RepID=A0AAV0B522_PHAPC|nr:hypothetical protein PPACK8108_LOCUS12238 [Phakopsora pachyrhizi]
MNLLTSGSRSEILESETNPSQHQSIISQLKQTHSEDYHQSQLQQLPPLSSQRYYYSSTLSSSLYSSEPNSDLSLTLLLPLLKEVKQPTTFGNQQPTPSTQSQIDGPIDLSPKHDNRFDSNTIRNIKSNWQEDRLSSSSELSVLLP